MSRSRDIHVRLVWRTLGVPRANRAVVSKLESMCWCVVLATEWVRVSRVQMPNFKYRAKRRIRGLHLERPL